MKQMDQCMIGNRSGSGTSGCRPLLGMLVAATTLMLGGCALDSDVFLPESEIVVEDRKWHDDQQGNVDIRNRDQHWIPSDKLCVSVGDNERQVVDLKLADGPKQVLCDKIIPGGPWVLVSTRFADGGSLLDNEELCTSLQASPGGGCSGHIPELLACDPGSMTMLFTTIDGDPAYRLSLSVPAEIHAFLTGARELNESNSCGGDHLCGYIDSPAEVIDVGGDFTPAATVDHGYALSGGLALFSGGGLAEHHVVSLNMAEYPDAPGPLMISRADSETMGDIVNDRAGALFFNCRRQ